MARFSRLKVLNTMIGTGVVPVFYDPSTVRHSGTICGGKWI